MTTTDPIADMLARINNALLVRYESVAMPASSLKVAVAKILKEEGYIEDFQLTKDQLQAQLVIRLKYVGDLKHQQPVITGLKRISKPGRRIYTPSSRIPWVRSGMGIAILSTPKGVLTGEQARRLNVGGEILCYVW